MSTSLPPLSAMTRRPFRLPCPFCGWTRVGLQKRTRGYFIQCGAADCKARGPRCGSARDALLAWNSRAFTDPMPSARPSQSIEALAAFARDRARTPLHHPHSNDSRPSAAHAAAVHSPHRKE